MFRIKRSLKVPIEIEGKRRHLLLDWQAAFVFEICCNKPIFNPATFEGMTLRDTFILLWACLRHEDEQLASEWALDLMGRISEEKVDEIGRKLRQAWEAAMTSQLNNFR